MTIADLCKTALPLNRKERFFTGTVFPMLVCADDFEHFGRLTKLLGLGPMEVDPRPETTNIQFFTEYGFAESCVGLASEGFKNPPTRKDTPDVLIFLAGKPNILIAIEAKMYDVPGRADLDRQLGDQESLLDFIAKERAPCEIVHVALLPRKLADAVGKLSKPTVTWEQLRDTYEDVAPQYFLAMLDHALASYETLRSRRDTNTRFTGAEICEAHASGSCKWLSMGRRGGLHGEDLKNDIESGAWKSQLYECSSEPSQGPNWFSVEDFAAIISRR